ncbi:Uncharacterised protein [Citrobacter koseri]|uniref:Uncharacterized protein n=1 Tax=Citrobacter koseri TaxID=545 RepID=A0A2X2YUN4_CITKO|nr:Uncharacterised protein [Citrobacter koseri]
MVTRLTCHCLFSTRSITNRCKSRLSEVRRLSQFFTRLIQPLSLMPLGLFILGSLYD